MGTGTGSRNIKALKQAAVQSVGQCPDLTAQDSRISDTYFFKFFQQTETTCH